MKEILKRLWKFGSDPKYMDFLDRQTRSTGRLIKEGEAHYTDAKIFGNGEGGNVPNRPATIVDMKSPLDVFPTDDPDQQDGNITNLTS